MQALKHCHVMPEPPPDRQRQVSCELLAQVSEQKAPLVLQAEPLALAGQVVGRRLPSVEPASGASQP
jgi:hypothetical protein